MRVLCPRRRRRLRNKRMARLQRLDRSSSSSRLVRRRASSFSLWCRAVAVLPELAEVVVVQEEEG